MNKLILSPLFWILVIVALGMALTSGKVFGEPFISAEMAGVRLVVHTEECAVKEIKNLPRRATWTEKGKTTEGCAGLSQEIEMIVFYWADGTVTVIPSPYFQRVHGS